MQTAINCHLYLVSNLATPNISPALDSVTRPDKVVLMVSADMRNQAELLSRVLSEASGVQLQNWAIEDPWDIEHIITRTMELLEQFQDHRFILNATGGTKPMSIGAFQAFQAYDLPAFYVHPEDDRLIWLHPREHPAHQLADRVKLPHFLLAHGSKVIDQGQVGVLPQYREFAHYLIDNLDYFSHAISTLNWYAANSNEHHSPELELNHQHWDALNDLIDRLETIGILSYKSQRLWFKSSDDKHFANGGWLEQHVYAELLQIRQEISEIQDLAQSMTVVRVRQGETIENELDVACLCNNHLYVIECKTRHLDRKSSQVATDTIYKIDSLKEKLGGIYGQGMIVSYKSMSAPDKHRAADLGIEICDGQNLQNLRSIIMQ